MIGRRILLGAGASVIARRSFAIPACVAPIANPYIGFVATGCRIPAQLSTSLKFMNFRKRHIARGNIINPSIVLANFYVPSAEAGSGGPVTWTASIEYPIGTFTQCPMITSGGIAVSGTFITSDPTPGVSIPDGAVFFSHGWASAPAGILFSGYPDVNQDNARGELFEYSATILPDRTLSSSYTSSDTTNMAGPIAIVASTALPGIIAIGDSIGAGRFDDVTIDASTSVGIIERAVCPFYGCSNVCIPSETMALFQASHAQRALLGNTYASHVVMQHGANDFPSFTAAQLEAAALNIKAIFPLLNAIQATTTPRDTGTFPAGTGQAPTANDAQRIAWNDNKRTTPVGYSGFLEMANVFETNANASSVTVQDGGFWKQNLSGDGLHPNTTGYGTIAGISGPFQSVFYR